MVQIKSDSEIAKMHASADLVGRTLGEVASHVQPGARTADLDRIAEEFILKHGARPAFKGYRVGQLEYPSTLCISVNDQVVHGIPGEYRLAEGDLVSIDCGVVLDGYYGDSAFTFAVGEIDQAAKDLCNTTYHALGVGIDQAVSGNRVGDISYAVQTYCEQRGYGVVRDLVGHGIGRELHEDPQVPNVGRRGAGRKLKEGIVLCIEPMINMGGPNVATDGDGWTVRTADSRPSAHYEHMVVVRPGEPEVLTTFKYIEEVITPPYTTEQVLQHG
jgi:methionyl aminopeptidase